MVVGSGKSYYNVITDTEIYSQNDNSFQMGPSVPYHVEGAASVQYGDSFIVVGGFNWDCYCEKSGKIFIIYLYSYNKYKLPFL